MKTITQLKDDLKALMRASADIDAKATSENRGLSDNEKNLKHELLDKVEEINTEIKVRERELRVADALASPEDAVTVPKNSDVRVRGDKNRDKFSSLGEQLGAIINAGKPGGITDPRLYNTASGLNETVGSEGGFLVQQDLTTKIYEDLFGNGLIAGQCEKLPISGSSNSIKVNGFDETSRASSTAGGIVVYHDEEAGEKTASKPKFRKVELSLKKLIGLCYLTDELIMDAPAMETRVSSAFRSAFNFQVQDDIINGSGAGMALGILNAGCLISVPKEAGQEAATIAAENIVKMYSRRFAAQTANYAWYYNQDIEPQLFLMSKAVGTGGTPIYMPPGGLSASPYGRLMGLPAYAIEQCATLGTQGDIILANFADGYLMAEKGGLTQDMSIHVRFIYDESVLRFVLRMDGQPWRASALTPYKGSNTQSHFITLATRA